MIAGVGLGQRISTMLRINWSSHVEAAVVGIYQVQVGSGNRSTRTKSQVDHFFLSEMNDSEMVILASALQANVRE